MTRRLFWTPDRIATVQQALDEGMTDEAAAALAGMKHKQVKNALCKRIVTRKPKPTRRHWLPPTCPECGQRKKSFARAERDGVAAK